MFRKRAGARQSAAQAARAPVSSAKETESEEHETTEAETDGDGYLADGYSAEVRPHANNNRQGSFHKTDNTNFENLQAISKWFPNAYRPPKPEEESPEEVARRRRSEFWVRTRWTFVMFFAFLVIIASGHPYVVLLVLGIKIGMFKEILSLKRDREKDKRMPYFRSLNWYFFGVTIYFVYGRILQQHVRVVHLEHNAIGWLSAKHSLKAFVAWMVGFCTFILSLEKGAYKYQFTQFGWTHMTLLMVVVTASCMISNIFDGMIWFYLPVCLVIWNDVYAYVFGRVYGRTPLIKLSPKKTWEGFLGALVTTVIFGWWAGYLLPYFEYMTCPQEELTLWPFPRMVCGSAGGLFEPSVALPLPKALGLGESFGVTPFLGHVTAMSVFASLVAPFGGFFASGFKRAFKIKDFGDLIPGHGGITDRMDCQIIMSVFVAVYRNSFLVSSPDTSVAKILSQVDQLPLESKLELLSRLQAALQQ